MKKILFFIGLFIAATPFFGQGIQTDFGKNSVQYQRFSWSEYTSPNFITYWHQGGENIGRFTVLTAEKEIVDIQNLLDYRLNSPLLIMVYTDLTMMQQTNIGGEERLYNNGGVTRIIGNKMFVYFDGNHERMRRQIREGIAQILLNNMLFGNDIQEVLQNAVMLHLPKWYTQGLVAFAGEGWNTTLDNRLREAVLSKNFTTFADFAKKDPTLAGHALWYFISQNYGRSSVSNLLYMTRINRNVDSGFLYVLGSSYRQTAASWKEFFTQRYLSEQGNAPAEADILPLKVRKEAKITDLKISPSGSQIAYVTNKLGKTSIYLQNTNGKNNKVIWRSGLHNRFQTTDLDYPLIAWHRNSQELAILYEEKGNHFLTLLSLAKDKHKTVKLPASIQRVLSADFVGGNDWVFSAVINGYTDLVVYNIDQNRITPLTRDAFDDLQPSFFAYKGQKGLLFSSNRGDDEGLKCLPDSAISKTTNLDLYYLNIADKKIIRLTNTPFANEMQACASDSSSFSFLSDNNGIYNRYLGEMKLTRIEDKYRTRLKNGQEVEGEVADKATVDTVFAIPQFADRASVAPVTNYKQGIELHHTDRFKGRAIELFIQNEQPVLYFSNIDKNTEAAIQPSVYRKLVESAKINATSGTPATVFGNPTVVVDSQKVDIDHYTFQSEYEEPTAPILVQNTDGSISLQKPPENLLSNTDNTQIFNPKEIKPYSLRFQGNYVGATLDNSLLYGGRDIYRTGFRYFYPAPSILLRGSVKDIFEDHRLEVGMRIPVTFNGSDFFVNYHINKRRVDKTFSLYYHNQKDNITYRSLGNVYVEGEARYRTILAEARFSYPFSMFSSLRGTIYTRNDQGIPLAQDRTSLELPRDNNQRVGLRAEYVFDNSADISMNIKNGTRLKFFAESFKNLVNNTESKFSGFGENYSYIVGFDARQYVPVLKHSIWASRLAGSTSFGAEKMLYIMGGVDNGVFASYNETLNAPGSDFAYRTLASNMRGFKINSRNGNSFAVFNTELRVPVFHYLGLNNATSQFWRNFQAVGFFDVGTAWVGRTPFAKNNPINTSTISNSVVSVQVNYFRDPIIAGYGFGIRSTILGYFARLDYAWGIETGIIQPGMFHLSLGTDF